MHFFYHKRFSNADIITQCLSNLPYLQYRQTKDRGNFRYYKTFFFSFSPYLKMDRQGLYVKNVVGGSKGYWVWNVWILGFCDNCVSDASLLFCPSNCFLLAINISFDFQKMILNILSTHRNNSKIQDVSWSSLLESAFLLVLHKCTTCTKTCGSFWEGLCVGTQYFIHSNVLCWW